MQVTEDLLKYNNRVKDNHKGHIRLEGILNRFLSCYLHAIVGRLRVMSDRCVFILFIITLASFCRDTIGAGER